MALRGYNGHLSATSVNNSVNVSAIGIQANDIVLLFAVWTGTGLTFTLPSGFTTIPGLSNINLAGSQTVMAAAYKVATASEPTSYQITASASGLSCVVCRVYAGRVTSSPFTAVASTPNTQQTASIQNYAMTGLTTAASDDLVEFVANQYYIDEPPGFSVPPGYNNLLFDEQTITDLPIVVSCDYCGISAANNWTNGGQYTNSSANPLYYAGFQISLAALNPLILTAGEAAFALTGEPAVFGGGLACSPGAFAFTGQPQPLTLGATSYELLAAPGSFVTEGANAVQQYELFASPGSFLIAGFDVPLGGTFFMTVSPGYFTIASYFANLSIGGFPLGATIRVQATQAGFYDEDYKDIGDVFDVFESQFSDSTVSQVPTTDPDYPIYGWMKQVPANTPLFSWASSGLSSPRLMPRRTVE